LERLNFMVTGIRLLNIHKAFSTNIALSRLWPLGNEITMKKCFRLFPLFVRKKSPKIFD
jgi:hypothetical protein